ncbi:MAG: hypothetical protein NTX61_05795 [Bacteroidetes bacterium]|nr:hypothetical protein [Bacteroidota bacterium]
MKQLVLITILFTTVWFSSFAQQPQVVGTTHGRGKVGAGTATRNIQYSIGQIGVDSARTTGNAYTIQSGFPYGVLYLNYAFTKMLRVSKGYFADYVQLEWDVNGSNADYIKRFYVYRRKSGETDSAQIAILDAGLRMWQDPSAASGTLYEYILYADGITNDFRVDKINTTRGVGFRMPTGRISGRITYEGGTAVEGVNVIAETDDRITEKSLFLAGNSYLFYHPDLTDTLFSFQSGFGFQTWFRPSTKTGISCLFQKGDQYKISYDDETNVVTFIAGTQTLTLAISVKANTFFHIAATNDGTVARLMVVSVMTDKPVVFSTTARITGIPVANINRITIGKSDQDEYLNGYLKDIRLWNKALDSAWIVQNASRFLSGEENGLSGYYSLNEGSGTMCYDRSRTGESYNEHHINLVNTVWSDSLPSKMQLSIKGITDANGNYSIVGIPYMTNGSTYRFTPMTGQHTFEPKEALLYLGKGANVNNGINFTDKSSFKVNGNVRYANTKFPVEGVTIKVDDRASVTSSGKPVVTDAMGNFTVDVPIGLHTVSVAMYGHNFEYQGCFPKAITQNVNGQNTIIYPKYDFQTGVSGLEFTDTTKIKVIGRVVGGPVQAAKKHVFGKSMNNLGTAQITLTTQKGNDLALVSTQNTWEHSQFVAGEYKTIGKSGSKSKIEISNPVQIKIFPDSITGEFVAYLLPEKYIVKSVTAGNYNFGPEFMQTIDLTRAYSWSVTVDTILTGEVMANNGKDTIRTYRIDSLQYQQFLDFIYRVPAPSIEVTAVNGSAVFGDSKLNIEENGIQTTLPLVDATGKLLLSNQIFTQRESYRLKVNVSETYINNGVKDIVPVTDGKVEITNDLAIDNTRHQLDLNNSGTVIDVFSAGLPSLTGDYSRTLSITAITGKNGAIKTEWKQDGATFRGIVLGGMPLGTNFTTKGPNRIDIILRDPPGNGSYSYMEKGITISSTKTIKSIRELTTSAGLKLQLGAEVKVFAGVGVGTITETEYSHDITASVTYQNHYENNNTYTQSTTTNESWKTSAEYNYVGAPADLFIGHSENIIYGRAQFIDLIPENQWDANCLEDTLVAANGTKYRLGQKIGFRFSPKIATTFMYTQDDIENKIIPDLRTLRNNLITRNPAVYFSHYTAEDEKFGSNNTPPTIVSADMRKTTGDSYNFIIPVKIPADSLFPDSVAFFNQEIKHWIDVLAQNEKTKATALFKENVSIGGGVEYEKSIEYDTSSTHEEDYAITITPKLEADLGFSFNHFGLHVLLSGEYGMTRDSTQGTETEKTRKYGYVLVDKVQGDFISLDILKPDDGYGPVFKIQGGQTCCPFEKAVVSKYYNPGTILSNATEQMEIPLLRVDQASVNNVPENQAALFTLRLSNENKAFSTWFMLMVDEISNPNGALLSLDGSPIGNGRLIFMPPGQEIVKLLSVSKVRPDVYEYKDLKLILHSTCQYDPLDNQEDILSEASVTARFQPVCSPVAFGNQTIQWVTNSITGDQMPIEIKGYNLDHNSLRKIIFQYKAASSSQWITEATWYKNQADFKTANAPKFMIGNVPKIEYTWDMHSLIDRNYDVRLRTECDDGSTFETEKLSGIKDVKPPKLFGNPQPADGVLSAGEDVSVQFDEPIEAGLLVPYNFTVQAVVNGTKISHNASLYFDGKSASTTVPAALSLAGKSFTIELWVNPNDITTPSTILFYGESESRSFQLGLNSGKLQIKNRGQNIEVPLAITQARWQHVGIAYNTDTKTFDIYIDDKEAENIVVKEAFTGSGKLLVGTNPDKNKYFNGYVHELCLWTQHKNFGEVYASMNICHSGNEVGMGGYWPMDEADGTMCLDKARSRNATIKGATWSVEPRGKARMFNGTSSYLALNTASTVIVTNEMDYTIEFWFKTPGNGSDMCLFSSGKGDGNDIVPSRALSIMLNANGNIITSSNNNALLSVTDKSYSDNNWHHFAFVLNRNGNVKALVDGELKANQPSTAFGALAGAEMWLGARGYIQNPAMFAEFDAALASQKTAFTNFTGTQHIFDSCQDRVTSLYAKYGQTHAKNAKYDSVANLFSKADSGFRQSDSVWTKARNDYFAATTKQYITINNANIVALQTSLAHIEPLVTSFKHADKTAQKSMDTAFVWLLSKYNALLADHRLIQSTYAEVYKKYKLAQGPGTSIYTFDKFFKGNIDELRIWNVARSITQLGIDKNSKLTGTEKGLLAYYPFERYITSQGIKIIDSTLNDNYIARYQNWPTGGTATAVGGAFSQDAPNMKDARPVQQLAFDWVTNNDKIIINVKESPELIEKCIVEFTVEGVEDKNQNRLSSPVTWTAFVSRNQVKWDENTLSLNKELYAPLGFDVKFTNNGGKQHSFELQNLPIWLNANPSSGTINPQSSINVHFNVNAALNSGSYDETIYLKTDEGTPESIALSLLVCKVAPDWKVNPIAFENSMNIIAQISNDGVLSVNPNDKIGVFVNGECRGVANLQYFETADLFESYIDVYSSSTKDENLEFRIWNANSGLVLGNLTPNNLKFAANTFIGSPLQPSTIFGTDTYMQQIVLEKGWNWISFNVESELLKFPSRLMGKTKAANGDILKSKDYSGKVTRKANSMSLDGNIATRTLSNKEMYMIYISSPDTLIYFGTALDPDSIPITVNQGWNWIGYTPHENMMVNEALAQITPQPDDVIKSQLQFATYVPSLGWVGSLKYLAPGNGYMYYSKNSNPFTFNYPQSGSLKKGK